jgi:two-component system, response regulator YesN
MRPARKARDGGGGESAPVLPEDRVSRILQIIQTETPQKISDLASEFKLSGSHLQHLFKQQTGVGLGRLLTEQRLQKAAQLLVHTDMRVKEIAALVGYEHTSSFTRAFVQRFAQTPLSYRASQASRNRKSARGRY